MNSLPRGQRLMVGLGASVLLHGALVLPWWVHTWWPASAPPRQTLALDLMGMLGQRQVDEQHALAAPHHAAPPRPAAPAAKHPAPKAPTQVQTNTAPSPVQVAHEPDKPPPTPAAPTAQQAAPATPTVPPGQDTQTQLAQTMASREQIEAALMRQYLAALRKAVQARLQYPDEARAAQWVGTPVIHFTVAEDGEIVPGSLGVQKSSGHAVLDDAALRAVQDIAAMPKPPRRMNVAMALSFDQAR